MRVPSPRWARVRPFNPTYISPLSAMNSKRFGGCFRAFDTKRTRFPLSTYIWVLVNLYARAWVNTTTTNIFSTWAIFFFSGSVIFFKSTQISPPLFQKNAYPSIPICVVFRVLRKVDQQGVRIMIYRVHLSLLKKKHLNYIWWDSRGMEGGNEKSSLGKARRGSCISVWRAEASVIPPKLI